MRAQIEHKKTFAKVASYPSNKVDCKTDEDERQLFELRDALSRRFGQRFVNDACRKRLRAKGSGI